MSSTLLTETRVYVESTRVRILKTARVLHLYVGAFISPAILFFAFTGLLQTFSLHENAKDGNYRPPRWVVSLAQLHKKQTIRVPASKLPASMALKSGDPGVEGGEPGAKKHTPASVSQAPPRRTLPMKIFFALVSVGLCISTATGLYMSYSYVRSRMLLSFAVAAGVIVPVLLLFV